jgi:hypothetical protein
MIGGTDVVLKARADFPVADLVLRTVRRHWPDFVIQDADDATRPFTPRNGVWLPKPTGREFFLYRDETAARNWDEFGATSDNGNSMLHVLVGRCPDAAGVLRSVTIVCDRVADDVAAIIEEIRGGLNDSIYGLRQQRQPRKKAA